MALKILLLQQYYFPEMAGGARRAKELSEQFVKKGHSVTVLTTYPRDFRSMPGFEAKKYEVLNNVFVIRNNTIFNVGKNPIFRMISYFMYVIHSFIFISRNRKKYDILISQAPLPSAIAAALANKFYKIFHHFDVLDILPDLGIAAGMIKNKLFITLLYNLEKWVYDHSNTISTVTEGQLNNINNKGISKTKLCCIPDWIDNTFFKINLDLYKSEIMESYNYQDKTIISFVGNIGVLQNPKIFIQLMESLIKDKLDEFLFLFIGDGIMLPKMKKIVKNKNLQNVEFIGKVKRELIPALMRMSDILVTNYLSDEHLNLYIPGKLFEYAISERPIIIGARGDAKNFIEKYGLGLVVSPSDVIGFKNAIIKISDGSFKYEPKISQFTNDYSIENVTKLYDGIFNILN